MNKFNISDIKNIFKLISKTMKANREYLVELDSKAGDGDLGISMSNGFEAVAEGPAMEEENIRKLFMKAGMTINEASPSSLGTIIFMGLLGGAKAVGDVDTMGIEETGKFFEAAAQAVMDKTGSKPGEKTILDSVIPGAQSLLESAQKELNMETAFKKAYDAAEEGMKATVNMKAVHGRAAYYGDKSIGIQDGGATVGMILFKCIYKYVSGGN